MNHIDLHLHANGKYALHINSQCVKEDFTGATYEAVVQEVNDYITASTDGYGYDAGVPRLSGNWNDNTDLTISYSTEADDTSFDGSNNYKINFIRH